MGMNTDINTIDSQYTNETIQFDDSQLDTIISNVETALTSLENLSTQLSSMESYESTWSGKSKTVYKDLKYFIEQYQEDYIKSVQALKSTATGLQDLLGEISSASPIKEIDNA